MGVEVGKGGGEWGWVEVEGGSGGRGVLVLRVTHFII